MRQTLDVGEQPALARSRRPDDADDLACFDMQALAFALAALGPARQHGERARRWRRLFGDRRGRLQQFDARRLVDAFAAADCFEVHQAGSSNFILRTLPR